MFTLQHSIFCDISQAQYFHLYQIATSFCLKFFLSSLPRISLPHPLSLSTSLSDFLNFQHFFCKYFCYATKLFFNTTFTKLFFSTLLSQSFFFNTSSIQSFSARLLHNFVCLSKCQQLFLFCRSDSTENRISWSGYLYFRQVQYTSGSTSYTSYGGSLCVNTSLQSQCTRSLHYETYDCDKRTRGLTNPLHYQTETMRAF